jgi:hypothetical protein
VGACQSNVPTLSVLPAAPGFFPLDEQLALLPGQFSPTLQAMLVRLSAWMPFAQAAAFLHDFAHVSVSEGSAQRLTYAAGSALVLQQTQATQQILRDLPLVPVPSEPLQVSIDGAMVPLVGGEWAEVKTLAIGQVTRRPGAKGSLETHTSAITTFSRMAEAELFGSLATVEAHTRGVTLARQVVAVNDGAEWIQRVVDLHCPTATRIIDFPHAAQRLSAIAAAVWGEGQEQAQAWFVRERHELRHNGPEPVLAAIHQLQAEYPKAAAGIAEHEQYLRKRVAMLDYPDFEAAGWPIGSGIVESANKLVVEARLKGAGMHWARRRVNPMVALRNLVCNERWQSGWAGIAATLRQEVQSRRKVQGSSLVIPAARPKRLASPQPGGKAHPPPATHPWRKPTLAGGRTYLERRRAAQG